MKRAIAIFLENKENLINDFWGLYFSLKYIKSNDTDLVVFGPKDVLEKIPNDCVKVECNPISYEFPWTNSKLPSTYHFINSIYFLCTPQAEILLDYDYVLKTDADTFLTPHWNNYYPENYSTGYSCYINDQITMDKIKEVANELNLQSKGEHIHRVGASHYGKPQLIIDIMKLTYKISQYMLENTFKDDIGKWPGWFYGVTSMYAGEIAVNHLIEKFSRDIYKIDYPNNDIEGKTKTENAVHIHSHHSFNLFSKFNFNKGEYDNVDISTLDISIVKNYSLYMALSGKKLKMENNMENNAKQNNFTSIIILTWNNLRYTKECIESIREHTNKELYEIIVVDNNSTDGTVDWLKGETDLKCIFNETNNGFSKGNNQGIEIAIGDSILFLNNDVVATPNWLFNLRIALFSSERIGAVGPLTNYAFGQAITVPYPLEDMSEMTKFAKDNNYSNPAGWEEKLKLIGFCMLVKMDTVKKIGGLDESFSPAHFEDDDYCYRIDRKTHV